MSVTLVLGGARSGKSRFAENLSHGIRHYVATAQAFDDEMRARIALHQAQRGEGWITHEEIYDLPQRLESLSKPQHFILVDCLTLWLSNLMLADHDVESAGLHLISVLQMMQSDTVLVSNEVGLGIVPETPLGRAFRDAQGRLNQQVAAMADNVIFIAAGLPLVLKGQMPKRPEDST
jgi:adenosylcobinamide kinase / adenosylcobinamide-phosphate guanylyltransferase